MATQLDEFSGTLSPRLLDRAYKTRTELAWSRQDALEAIDSLTNAKFDVIGVEVWVPSHPGPTMTGWSWSSNDARVPGKPHSAREFVENFEWSSRDFALKGFDPYFNFTTA